MGGGKAEVTPFANRSNLRPAQQAEAPNGARRKSGEPSGRRPRPALEGTHK